MDIFNSKDVTATVVRMEWVEDPDNKNYFKIDYYTNDPDKVKSYRDYVNFAYPRKAGWATPENITSETYKICKDVINHVGERYSKFFTQFYDKGELVEAYKDCILKGLPFIANEKEFAKYMQDEEWTKKFHTALRNAVGCFISYLVIEIVPTKMYFNYSWDGKYFNPTKPESLTTVYRTAKIDGKNEKVTFDYKGAYAINFAPNAFNAQYPFQKEKHNLDIVGKLYEKIVKSDGLNDKEMYKGICTPYTYKQLTTLRIQKKPEAVETTETVEAQVGETADTPVPDEW